MQCRIYKIYNKKTLNKTISFNQIKISDINDYIYEIMSLYLSMVF